MLISQTSLTSGGMAAPCRNGLSRSGVIEKVDVMLNITLRQYSNLLQIKNGIVYPGRRARVIDYMGGSIQKATCTALTPLGRFEMIL